MNYLSNELLIEVYIKAIMLEFDEEFIQLLEEELHQRKIEVEKVLNEWFSG